MHTILNIFIFLLLIIRMVQYNLQRNKKCADKKYFVEVLKHNLKICMLAQNNGVNLLLKEGAKTDLQKELFSTLANSCKYNLDIITNLLNTYKFENNEQCVQIETFELDELNVFSCKENADIINEKNIKIINDYTNCKINADRYFITELFTNLIYIALVHSYRNTTTIITVSNKGKNLQVNVAYRGNTLSNEALSSGKDYMAVGCGIKMYYCKKIVNFYGGRIRISDTCKDEISMEIILPVACVKTRPVYSFQYACQ